MQKSKYYYNTKFPALVIDDAYKVFLSKFEPSTKSVIPDILSVSIGNETWNFDTIEEFLAEYPKSQSYKFEHYIQSNYFIISCPVLYFLCIIVKFPTRPPIESIFQVFERNLNTSALPGISFATQEPIKIFMGHGHDTQWRDLKDHLHEQHGFDVEAYEISPRAGQSVKEVLEEMLNNSSFAILVLTGDDVDNYGELHARDNVIHELDLFKGFLGFKKAIILLEDGEKEFSNILGINQIRFPKGAIRQTFGDILDVIKREFNEE